ncbi:MAG: acetyl-CoA C-acyltransferase [Promethearchaeota archaeon]
MELKETWLIDYARTPFSRSRPTQPERDAYGEIPGVELCARFLKGFFDEDRFLAGKAITREDIQEVAVGAAVGYGENISFSGRLPIWMAGFPFSTPAFYIERACCSAGSGLQVAAMEIMTGQAKITMAAGYEHMTRAFRIRNAAASNPHPGITDEKSPYYRPDIDYPTTRSMLQTAQKLYEQEVPTFTKEEMDKFGVRSHNLTIKNQEGGWFKDELIPIMGHVQGNVDEPLLIERDLNARPSSMEGHAKLPRLSKPFYLKKNGGKEAYVKREGTEEGVITVGSASPLNAGATTALLMEAKEAEKRGLEPLARIVSLGWAGVDPSVMGRGPVPATKMALENAGLTADDIDYWEINEAFCIVALNCLNHYNVPWEKVNVMGGSTAIGHPLGATMIRLPGTLARILKDKKAKYGLATACAGFGQGISTLIENLDA